MPSIALADEGGVSFWLPGFFGSLAAAPQQPGWSLTSVYYHTSVSAGADVGSTAPIYKHAEYFTFCSAKLSRATAEAESANVGYCPYLVFIYETEMAPGTIHVGYRSPPLTGSDASRAALGEVQR